MTETIEYFAINDKGGNDTIEEKKRATRPISIGEEETVRTETDPRTQVKTKRRTDPLYRQAKTNVWYQWMNYTRRTHKKKTVTCALRPEKTYW